MRLFLHELRAQQRLFWRSRELAFFTFLLPLILFVLLGSVNEDGRIEGIRGSDYLLAGMIGYGATATFSGLTISLVFDRERGVLKRLRATPLRASTLVAAMLASSLIVFVVEVVLLVVVGKVLFDARVPPIVDTAAVVLVGASVFAALGVALVGAIKTARGASPIVNAIFLPMAFLSGSFFSPEAFPTALQRVADVLPLTYYIEVVRDVVLEGARLWADPSALAVLAAWGGIGLVAAIRWFRWEPQER